MILKKRIENRGRRKGFTLVEVIVVLVILAILAAIAIPALTGYIDKAEDKKYIADARNRMTALKAIMDESYAQGDFSKGAAKTYFESSAIGFKRTNAKLFRIEELAQKVIDTTSPNAIVVSRWSYFSKASKLVGEPYSGTANYWVAYTVGPNTGETTAFTADGFIYEYYPEGYTANKPAMIVTYKMDKVTSYTSANGLPDGITGQLVGGNIAYNPDAGFEVYKANLNSNP
jgi:prepilin-type N-terminal cleavage/methylation domain-containing protein